MPVKIINTSSMEQQISKYRVIYKIFVVLMLVGFIDSIVIPALFNSMGKDLGDIGFIPRLLAVIAGKAGAMVAIWFELLWFVWGLIAVIYNRLANRLQKRLTQGPKI